MLNFVSLPTGRIINLDAIAFLTPIRAPEKSEKIRVTFLAVYSLPDGDENAMSIELDEEDSMVLLSELNRRNVSTDALRNAAGLKLPPVVNSGVLLRPIQRSPA